MSQPPQTPQSASPLTARMYDLEYPRSLGVYSTYQEVQSVVDTLADHEFPVQSTLIVGTDLKLMERVTGRKTWPKVISQGALSGLWMGLFLGLLLWLLNPGDMLIVLPAVVMGMVFFTIWQVIGYAMSGGRRDFTSMTSTIPMQYELLVEHKHAVQARQILAESGAAPVASTPLTSAPGPSSAVPGAMGHGGYGQSAPTPGPPGHGVPGQGAQAPAGQSPGAPGYGTRPAGAPGYGARPAGAPEYGAPSPEQAGPGRPSYGQPAPGPGTGAQQAADSPSRGGRPSFGRPAVDQDAAAPQSEGAQPPNGGTGSAQPPNGRSGSAQSPSGQDEQEHEPPR